MADYTSTVELRANTSKLERSMANARKSMDKLGKSTRDAKGRFTSLEKNGTSSLSKLNKSAKATNSSMTALRNTVAGLASGVALIALGRGVATAASKFEILRAQLNTMTGDAKKAEVAFNRLKKFADVTPFDFSESIKGFVKLKALGLVSTVEEGEKALGSYGNTAAAMGKTLEQMVEAVADAATGENERLKEFGIKARKQGEETAFTFQGVTTVVKNSAKDIQKYLLDIGNVQFAGAMAQQANGITAAMSNLRTNFALFLDVVGTGLGVVDAMTAAFNQISEILNNMIEAVKNNTAAFQTFKKILTGATAAGLTFMAVFTASKLKAIAVGMLGISKAMLRNPLFLAGGAAGFAIVELLEKFGAFEEGFKNAFLRMDVVWTNWVAGIKKNNFVAAVLEGAASLKKTFKNTIGTAYNYVANLDWGTAWDLISDGASAAWEITKGVGRFLEVPVKKAYSYLKGLDWSLALGVIGDAAGVAWDLTKSAYAFVAEPTKKAYDYLLALDWDSVWGTMGTAASAVWDITKEAYAFVATPLEKAYNYVKNIDWSVALGHLSIAADAAWASTKDAYAIVAEPLEKAWTAIKALEWSTAWNSFSIEMGKVVTLAKALYKVVADPVDKVFKYVSGITWSTMWSGLSSGIDSVKKWFHDMYIYLVGNSVVPDMVNEITVWFGTMATNIVAPVISVYDAVTGWFTKMYHKVTGTTKDTVTEINASLGDVHGFEPVGDTLFDAAKIEKLKVAWDELGTGMKVALGVVGALGAAFVTAFAIAKVVQFKNSINSMFDTFRNSTKTISGKQGLMNKIMYGTEGGSRRAGGEAAKFDKQAKLLDQGVKYRAAKTAAERKAALQGFGIFERNQIKKNATLRTAVMQHQASNARAEVVRLQGDMKGRGIFSRALFGRGSKDTLFAKVAGFTGQAKRSIVSLSTGLGRGAMSLATFGKGGSVGIKAKMAALVLSIKTSASGLRGNLEAKAIGNYMLYGKGGKSGAILKGWDSFKGALTGRKAKMVGVGALGLAGLLVAGTTAAGGLDGVKAKWDKFTQDLSFDKIKETATNAFAEYGTDGLMMWAMFGAPGSGLIVSGIAAAFVGLKAALMVSLAPAIGWLATVGAGILAGPVGWIGLAVAGAALATYVLWDKIKPVFDEMWESLETWFSDIKWIEMFTKIGDILLWPEISGAFDTMWTGISTFFKEIDWSGIWDGLLDSATSIAKDLAAKLDPRNWFGGDSSGTELESTGAYQGMGSIDYSQYGLMPPVKKANGGMVFGPGSETSDSIPALLSNGEFVVNAKSTRKHRALLESMNNNRFATGGLAGSPRGDQHPDIYRQVQFTGGRVDFAKTMHRFAGFLDEGSDKLKRLNRDMRTLSEDTYNLTEAQIKELPLTIEVNRYMQEAIALRHAEARAAEMATKAVEGLGEAAKKEKEKKNEFEGFGQTLTGPLKDALSRGDFKSIGDAIGEGIRGITQRISSKLLDRAFDSFEKGIDQWLLSLDKMEVEGEGMFSRLGNVFSQVMSSISSSGLGQGIGSAVSGIGSAIFGMLGGSMPTFATGGQISGAGTGTSDSIMARVSNGEFVVNAKAAKANLALLHQINGSRPSGNIPQFATGGSVNTGAAGSNGDIYLTLNNNYDVQSAMNPQEFQAMMANNAELSFLSVEKKLRETGRSLYKQG